MSNIAAYCMNGLDHENFSDLKIEITAVVAGEWKKRRGYFQRLGIEREDLIQGVAERLSRIDRRIRKGEFKPKRGTVKTWKSSHVKWAINDVVRNYQWSSSNYDRVKSKAYHEGKEPPYVCEVWSQEQAEEDARRQGLRYKEGKYPAYQVEEIEARETLRAVLEIMQSCSLRAQRIFYDYFVRERTMKRIGKELHVTESRVCQIVKFVRNRLVRGLIIRGRTDFLSKKMIEEGQY